MDVQPSLPILSGIAISLVLSRRIWGQSKLFLVNPLDRESN